MQTININGTDYVALRIDNVYIEEHKIVYKYCIRGQRADTLNWDMLAKDITYEFIAVLDAEEILHECANYNIPLYNVNGYAIEWVDLTDNEL